MSEKVTAVDDANFDAEVLASQTPVLVDFYADWCGPCKGLAPMLNDMAGEFEGELVIRKLDVEQSTAIRDRYGVRNLPTMILFRGGEEVSRSFAHTSRTLLSASIEKALEQ